MNQKTPSKAPNRPAVGVLIPSWARMGFGNPEGPAALEAKAAQLAAEAMRLRWQAQRLRGE